MSDTDKGASVSAKDLFTIDSPTEKVSRNVGQDSEGNIVGQEFRADPTYGQNGSLYACGNRQTFKTIGAAVSWANEIYEEAVECAAGSLELIANTTTDGEARKEARIGLKAVKA